MTEYSLKLLIIKVIKHTSGGRNPAYSESLFEIAQQNLFLTAAISDAHKWKS